MIRPALRAVPLLAIVGVLLTGCAAPAPTASSPSSSSPSPSAPAAHPEPAATPTASPTAEPVTATCENTVIPETLSAFEAYGWTAGTVDAPWVIVEDVAGGIACTWGDFSQPSDNVMWFAWAPLPDSQAEAVISQLMSQGGWTREEADGGVYVTADSTNALMVDEQGYSTTYFFTDAQVKAALTKSALVSVTAPPGFVP